jgi:hypothetical protein
MLNRIFFKMWSVLFFFPPSSGSGSRSTSLLNTFQNWKVFHLDCHGILMTRATYHFDADPDPAPHQTAVATGKKTPGLHFEPPGLHCEHSRPSAAQFRAF